MDSRLTYDGINYYLMIPYNMPVKEKNENATIVALDPGKRVFQTGYSESEYFEANINITKTENLGKRIRTLQSFIDHKRAKRPCNMKHKIRKLYQKITNQVDECHWKTASYLVKHYNDILLPSFETQDMVQKGCLHKKTKNGLLQLAHYRFKMRLRAKGLGCKNTRIHDVNESYTSQTCSCCGKLTAVGSRKIFSCSHCNMVLDRDVNAARNIFIKHVTTE